MERSEKGVQKDYDEITSVIPEAARLKHEEEIHEEKLVAMLDEERLVYAGSIVLGLNDALVELTGALAGLTLALQNVKLIALSGLITGIAASMSMAASEVSFNTLRRIPIKTRCGQPSTRALHISAPCSFLFSLTSCSIIIILILAFALTTAVIIIAVFNYYISVAKDESSANVFWKWLA